MRVMAAAPTSPVTCVLAPACSATAVREPLVLTGKPWNRPAAMFAAPMPVISRLPLTVWPVRAAKDEAVEMVSASETTVMPTAPASSSATSDRPMSGWSTGGTLGGACRQGRRRAPPAETGSRQRSTARPRPTRRGSSGRRAEAFGPARDG